MARRKSKRADDEAKKPQKKPAKKAESDEVEVEPEQEDISELLASSADMVVSTCMQMRSWENELGITDPPTAEIGQALDAAEADDEVRVVVLAGAGRAFCAGVAAWIAGAAMMAFPSEASSANPRKNPVNW